MNIRKSSKDNKLRQFSLEVTQNNYDPERTTEIQISLLMTRVLSASIQISIEHTFIYCQESNEFFSKNLGCFNDYHKENVKLSNKQNLFNTFEDSFTLQMSNPVSINRLRLLVLLQKKYLRKLLEQCRIESCGKQH